MAVAFERVRWVDPAWFLSDFEGSVEGVVCDKFLMALVGGVGASFLSDTNGDAVYEYFGPFDVGPCCDGACDWDAVFIGEFHYKFGEFVCNRVELSLSGGVMRCYYEVSLVIVPYGGDFYIVATYSVHEFIQGLGETR